MASETTGPANPTTDGTLFRPLDAGPGSCSTSAMSEQFPDNLPTAHEMYNQPKIPAGVIYDAIKEHQGNKAAICRDLGIKRRTLDERINKNPDLQELMNDLREEVIDVAESNIFRRAVSGADPHAEKFILTTIGRNRGYSTSVVGNGANGDIVVTIKRFGEDAE